MNMSSDLRCALAQLQVQPHIYPYGNSWRIDDQNVTNGLRALSAPPMFGRERSLIIVIRNYNHASSIIRVEAHYNPIDSNLAKNDLPKWYFAEDVDVFVVFPELRDWLIENSIDGIVSAQAFFKGGMDIASKLGRSISIVLIHGQGRQEERQFSPCRRVH